MLTINIHYGFDEESYERLYYTAPAHYVVCPRCDGRGTHDHPAFSNGITESEWRDQWDEEEREDYINGIYDVRCSRCEGERVVLDYDFDALPPSIQFALERLWEEERYEEAMRNAERRGGW